MRIAVDSLESNQEHLSMLPPVTLHSAYHPPGLSPGPF